MMQKLLNLFSSLSKAHVSQDPWLQEAETIHHPNQFLKEISVGILTDGGLMVSATYLVRGHGPPRTRTCQGPVRSQLSQDFQVWGPFVDGQCLSIGSDSEQ